MKWLKFLKDYDSFKIGEVKDFDPAAADILVKAGIAENTEQPKEVTKVAGGLVDGMKEYLDGLVKTTSDNLVTSLKAEFKAASKRPNIQTHDNADDDPTFGFKNIGEQVRMIKDWYTDASVPSHSVAHGDERMKRIAVKVLSSVDPVTKAPTTYANEGLGADGGFLLAPVFANTILMHTFQEEGLLGLTDTYTTGSNNLTIPKDETTPWGTNGVQVYWAGEAAQYTQSKPKFGQDDLKLHKITALIPVTDEQLADNFVGLGQYVTKQAAERINWKVDDAIVNGTGAGQPLGFSLGGALVSQAIETGQTTQTINLANAAKMISRIPSNSLKNLRWLSHPSALPQLMLMTNGNSSLWIGPGELEGKGPTMGRFMGIPLIPSQHCQSVGTTGDIYLVDLSKYLTLTKGDGVQTALSIHLYFDYGVSTFRLNFRVAGQPWLQAAITSAYGSYSMSPFISLATR